MNITLREKRILIGGGCVAALALLAWVGTLVIPGGDEIAREVENKSNMLVRQRDMIGREDFYNARIDQYRQRLEQRKARLLVGENPSISGAELQRVLKEIADQNGIEITRRDVQPQQNLQDNLVKVSVRIETKCEPDQLVRLLAAIGNYERFLTVDDLSITSFRIQKKWEIRPILTVAGYFATSGTPAAGPSAASQ